MKLEVCILAGGLSTRMGRDKARLRLGARTMLSIVRDTARTLNLPVRIIRRDAVPRCGPLGGVITGLRKARARAVLFLACDMPLVSAALLRRIIVKSGNKSNPVFAARRGRVGLPFLLPKTALGTAETQLQRGAVSLHEFAAMLKARAVGFPGRSPEWLNVNTPDDLVLVMKLIAQERNRDASLVTRAVRPYGSRHAKPPDCSLRDREPACRKRQRRSLATARQGQSFRTHPRRKTRSGRG